MRNELREKAEAIREMDGSHASFALFSATGERRHFYCHRIRDFGKDAVHVTACSTARDLKPCLSTAVLLNAVVTVDLVKPSNAAARAFRFSNFVSHFFPAFVVFRDLEASTSRCGRNRRL
jgi:hypothetical protein